MVTSGEWQIPLPPRNQWHSHTHAHAVPKLGPTSLISLGWDGMGCDASDMKPCHRSETFLTMYSSLEFAGRARLLNGFCNVLLALTQVCIHGAKRRSCKALASVILALPGLGNWPGEVVAVGSVGVFGRLWWTKTTTTSTVGQPSNSNHLSKISAPRTLLAYLFFNNLILET